MLTQATRLADFPSLSDMIYLNTAAEGIPPVAVLDALKQYGLDKTQGMDGRSLHEAQYDAAKALVAQAYGLTPQEIGICSCSSEAYNLAALALRLQPGDEVVINDLDFPAGVTPWLQPTCPATVKVWRAVEGALRVEDLIPLLTPRTRMVTVSLVSFYNGYKLSLDAVGEAVRQHSPALLAVDVTQALGRIPLHLAGADLIVSSTHKWILASHGGGLVGVPKARAEELTVPAGGWFNLQNAFDADRFERAIVKPGAASFAVGMPNYPAAYAVRAGLGYVLGIGVEQIDAHARPLVRACLEGVRGLPVELLTPVDDEHLAGIVAFRHPKAEAIHRYLHERNIHIMAHAGRLRVAIHGYNTAKDIERLLSALHEAISHV
ncbi:MAG: aminotransferase class V-fold PLP-dependent enzyme [Chloroflexi bacterium]|nr:aminotransferase class V-fold PLP-dependent enzyme [Chloroflexota bacterium]